MNNQFIWSVKGILATIAQKASLHGGVSLRLARRQRARTILAFHGVGDDCFPELAFRRLMVWLNARFSLRHLSAMVDDYIAGQPCRPGGEIAITFDDGLLNQARVAYPILHELRIPATIFVCPGLMDEQRWLWNHEARARLSRLPVSRLHAFAQEVASPGNSVGDLIEWMKTLPLKERESVETSLRSSTPRFAPTESERQRYDTLRWEDLRGFDSSTMAIGSHTLSHPILTTLDQPEIRRELAESRERLEQFLQLPVPLFCYPNGAFDTRVHALAGQYYSAAVTALDGVVEESADALSLRRVPATPNLALQAWRLHRPAA